MESLGSRMTKAVVGAASAVAPGMVGRAVAWLFLTPFKPNALTRQQKALMARAQKHLDKGEAFKVRHPAGTLQAYRFHSSAGGPTRGTVIFVHGWMGRAALMAGFIKPLTAEGFDVVCFDLPAHGRSDGLQTNGIICAAALQAVAAEVGPLEAAVGHSFGGFVIGLAAEGRAPLGSALDVKRIALIAAPNAFTDMTARLGLEIGLGPHAQAVFEKILAKIGGRRLSEFDGNRMLGGIDRPILVIHSRDDEEVPFAQGVAYQALGDHVTFLPVDRLGHRQILYAPSTIRSVRDFVSRHCNASPDKRRSARIQGDLGA
jgi:pimeloyl-ACP methyl ester carboxylesterase